MHRGVLVRTCLYVGVEFERRVYGGGGGGEDGGGGSCSRILSPGGGLGGEGGEGGVPVYAWRNPPVATS